MGNETPCRPPSPFQPALFGLSWKDGKHQRYNKLQLSGGKPLRGTVVISGFKHALVPMMAASLLSDETITISNTPDIEDMRVLSQIIKSMGGIAQCERGELRLNARNLRPDCQSAFKFGSDSNLMQSLIRVALPLGESAPCNKHFAAPVWCRVGLLSKVRSTTRIGPFSPSARLADSVFVHRAGRFPDAFIAIIGAA